MALVTLTLACVWLGVLTKRARDQRAAVARIEQLGGRIHYDWEYEYVERGQRRPNADRPGWPWMHRVVGPEFFQEVFDVRLGKSRATDADLRLIGKLRGVRMLSLSSTDVSDAGLHELRSWRLLHLNLEDSKITDEGIQHLRECTPLKSLNLAGTAVGDKTAQQLASAFPQLQYVDLSETRVTSQGIIHLAKLRNLRDLSFNDTAVDDAAVDTLISLAARDTAFDFTRIQISGRGLLRMDKAFPGRYLDDLFDYEDFDYTAKSNYRWRDCAERLLESDGERRVKVIDLSGSTLSDEQLALLHGLQNVELIDLRGSHVSDEAVQALEEALPHCEIQR